MQKPWLANYLEGVPAQISTDAYQSLVDLLDQACRDHAGLCAQTSMGQDLSYSQLDSKANAVAAWIQQQGLPAGSRVALMMPNVMAYFPIFLGVLRAGMVVVNVNPMYTARELEHQLKDSGAQLIFILEHFAATLTKASSAPCAWQVVLVSVGDLMGAKGWLINLAVRHIKKQVPAYRLPAAVRLGAVFRRGFRAGLAPPVIGMDDVALLQYTGGTTGTPKGAMLTHRNLVANVLQVDAVVRPVLGTEPQVILSALPLYHIFALTVCGLFAAHAGMRSVLIANPRDLDSIVTAWRRNPVQIIPAVNSLFNGLLNRSGFAALDFSALRLCFGGGAAVQQTVAQKWHKLTGKPLIEGYGLSETSPVVCVNSTNASAYSGDIGLPVPSTDVVMLDDQGRQVPLGEPGELSVRGPQVMKGYWQRPDETAAAFTVDGFFKTGDIGIMNEQGRVRLVDRKKDMILVSGFNVYPNEVEEAIAQHPGVLECAIVGMPDPHSGERIKLYVVRKDPGLTEKELRAWCVDRLTGYKRPRVYEFRDDLPKSNVGKILRRVLREDAVTVQPPA